MTRIEYPSAAAAARAHGLNPDWLRKHLKYIDCVRYPGRVGIKDDDLERFLSTFPVLPASALAGSQVAGSAASVRVSKS